MERRASASGLTGWTVHGGDCNEQGSQEALPLDTKWVSI
jgi:hypothetical protein